jgi:hypothetical protein
MLEYLLCTGCLNGYRHKFFESKVAIPDVADSKHKKTKRRRGSLILIYGAKKMIGSAAQAQ